MLSTGEKYRKTTDYLDPRNYSAIYLEYKSKTTQELFEIIASSKQRNYRLIAVYLLGKIASPSQEIIDFLRNLTSYENIDIRKEAAWALARLGDNSIQPKLLQILKTSSSDTEKSITARYLGSIGDTRSFLPLLELLCEDNRLSSFSAGIALHHLTDRLGLETLFTCLIMREPHIRIQVIWFLCARAMFTEEQSEKDSIISKLKYCINLENDDKVKLVLAYGLSTLNVAEGAKELLFFCLSDKIKKERQQFFWEEITRFYIYTQKKVSLELMSKLNNNIVLSDLSIDKTNKTVYSLLKKLEETIKDLDKIFNLSHIV